MHNVPECWWGYMTDPNTWHISLRGSKATLEAVAIQLDHALVGLEASAAPPGDTNECVVVRANIGLQGERGGWSLCAIAASWHFGKLRMVQGRKVPIAMNLPLKLL